MRIKNYEQSKKEAVEKTMQAIKSGKDEDIQEGITQLYNSIFEKIEDDFNEYVEQNDEKVLSDRGYKQLTSEEKRFYQALVKAAEASDAKQAFIGEIPDGAMPTTIIEDVYKELQAEHPLLDKINFQFVGFVTKWILSDGVSDKAQWGTVTDEIKKEITSSLKEIEVRQNKLSAFAIIPKGLLDMKLTFIDAYIKSALKESLALGLEGGIISGSGVNCPIGMIKNIGKGVDFNTTTGYPDKEAIKVKTFAPKEYGALVAKLAKTEKGNNRKFDSVLMVCNMTDYLSKIMPATTAVQSDGTYKNNIFPFPTDVTVSTSVPEGKAILGLSKEYSLLAGGAKEGTIEYDDSYKFLEDQRVYKIKQYAEGRAYDNTCFILIDISELEERYITVLNKTTETPKQTEETKQENTPVA
ncbi:phage major capsid protein [uncultured Eubacterium sp.]|uniref:phage major capsid protein n=1 Tax=uncultured Eubacterium sp. TaxID=165185 RepID=UPI002670EA2D|nr:phage major capsid protein [uncultured Eubacterium sp.]